MAWELLKGVFPARGSGSRSVESGNQPQKMPEIDVLSLYFPRLLICAAMTFAAIPAHAEASLYDRIGGRPVIERVVEHTIAAVVADKRVNQSFNKVNLKKLDASIVVQLCALTGGGCTYTGDDMKRAHAGLGITETELYALVDALREAMNANGIGEREKNELLKLLAPMKRDVVTR